VSSRAWEVIYRGEYFEIHAGPFNFFFECPLCGRLNLLRESHTFTPDDGGVSISPSLVCTCGFHAIVTRGVMTDVPIYPEVPPMRTPDELKLISGDDWTIEERQRGLSLAEEEAAAILKEKTGELLTKAGGEFRAMTGALERVFELKKQRAGLVAAPPLDGVVVDDTPAINAPAGSETAVLPFSTDTASPPDLPGAPAAPPAEMTVTDGGALTPAPALTAPAPVNLIKPSAAVAEDPAVVGAIPPAPPKEYGLQLIGKAGISPDVSNAKLRDIAMTLAAIAEMADIGATAAIVWDGDDLAGAATYTETVGWVVRVPRP
jgi:hypothetical protein